ncbi:MAG: di-heme oxidoredictase family protein [Wenzhouxiangella sp.]|nr:di-heme oxidoredictase family protein [Wenzhouxiangella sp.]
MKLSDSAVPPSFGFAINEATIFAPWRPWYMGHYCGWGVVSVTDSVCYEAYFTTQLQGYTDTSNSKLAWPRDRGAYFFPTNPGNAPTGLYCRKGEDQCSMYLAKVDWAVESQNPPSDPNEEKFTVTGCDVTVEPCDKDLEALQAEVKKATERLDDNFDDALAQFKDRGRFPWTMGEPYIPRTGPKNATMSRSPFIGYYDLAWSQPPSNNDRVVVDSGRKQFGNQFQAAGYTLPKECTKEDFARARAGDLESVKKLRDCSLTLEVHSVGFYEQWEHFFPAGTPKQKIGELVNIANANGLAASQYGRTMFFMAGLPEQKVAASFFTQDGAGFDYPSKLSIYDQVYGAGPYTQYLPMVNPDGDIAASSESTPLRPDGTVDGMVQPYADNMWHSFFMSNHMNQSPEHFIRGLRGRTLWHNEWRSNLMFLGYYTPVDEPFTKKADAKGGGMLKPNVSFDAQFAHRDFPAGFQPENYKVPYHGNTCDSCHIRNGSGIPLAPNGLLSNIHTERGINPGFFARGDYTYSNGYNPRLKDPTGKGNTPFIPSMKMVLFDLKEPSPRRASSGVDADDHTSPAAGHFSQDGYYNNKIMNFYGNSFHVNLEGKLPTYDLKYVKIGSEEDTGAGKPFEIVDTTERMRRMPDGTIKTYVPKRAIAAHFNTGDPSDYKSYSACREEDIDPSQGSSPDKFPLVPQDTDWPLNCDDVSGSAVEEAIRNGEVGFMHLLGKRLGNTPLIEMIPDQFVIDTSTAQKKTFAQKDSAGKEWYAPGLYPLVAGTRSGWSLTDLNYRSCRERKFGTSSSDCYIGRWGWIGDRASLEDQVANAAYVEQNITTKASYDMIAQSSPPESHSELVRYNTLMCGPADLGCQLAGSANSDITEQEVRDMATYQRWIGIPQRSEFQVETKAVQDGERVFRDVGCSHCHIIDKIPFVENDNMLPDEERAKLKKLLIQKSGKTDYPFVSYLGTDLLMHDMGYLSQVAKGTEKMRDPDTGVIQKNRYNHAYFQFIRTPPLKGLRFNRFVTDSHHNKAPAGTLEGYEAQAGCDFLLHDGRACDAIEAAYLHDGPAVLAIGMIEALNQLSLSDLESLRAFLYSL